VKIDKKLGLVFLFGDTNENMLAAKLINAIGGADQFSLEKIDKIRNGVVDAMNIAAQLQYHHLKGKKKGR
jgi:hypothetical protein